MFQYDIMTRNLLNEKLLVHVKKHSTLSYCILCKESIVKSHIFVQNPKGSSLTGICDSCIEYNKLNKYTRCVECGTIFCIDFTQLNDGDIIVGGMFAFRCCYKCLNMKNVNCGCPMGSDIDLFCGTSDGDEYDEMSYIPTRKLGREYTEELDYFGDFSDEKAELKNIKKSVSNCKLTDKKKINYVGKGKLESIGDITSEYVRECVNRQKYKCHECGDVFLTYGYGAYCHYKFSIDRINNNLPHNNNNIRITCYYCNCKNHVLFNPENELKKLCDNQTCRCHFI